MATVDETERAQRSGTTPADVPGDPSTTAELTIGSPTEGRVDEAFDQDWYRFTAQGRTTYRFEVDGEAAFNLTLYDADGNWIAETWAGHFLHVFAEDTELYVGAGSTSILDRGEVYTLGASELPDDYAASVATTGVVAAGRAVTGTIDYEDDADWFRLEVQAGTTYVFDLEGADSGAGTLTDPWLRQRQALPDAAIQTSDDNAPAGGGEVFATQLGGTSSLDDAVGVCRIDADGHLTPKIVFASSHAAQVGDSVSLGTVHVDDRLGLFVIVDGARAVPGLGGLGAEDLDLRNPQSGATAAVDDDRAPELLRLDGAVPVAIGADLVFAIDDQPAPGRSTR